MSGILGAAGPSAYWYLARGTGAVALVLLTASVVLGILGNLRFSAGPRWPRFTIDTLHRDISLLVMVLLVAHILTSVLDSFTTIGLLDAVIPFKASYRPLWLGLGALAFDVLLAVAITSMVRRRLGYGAWRAIHWLAYACWPVAVLHGLGTGSDTKVWWMLALTGCCVAAVLIAVWVRIGNTDPERPGLRTGAVALTIATPLALAIFTLQGPLQKGWARRAGTPASLLPKTYVPVASVSAARSTSVPAPPGVAAPSSLKVPFSARLTGTVTQTQEPGGAILDLALRLSGGAHGRLRVRMAGAPIDGGGLSMTGSQVDLLASGLPSVLQGQITALQGSQFIAKVSNASGTRLSLRAELNIDNNTGAVTGTLSASRGGG